MIAAIIVMAVALTYALIAVFGDLEFEDNDDF
jgi:hypothetical protein